MIDVNPEKEKLSEKYGFERFSTNIEDAFADNIDIVDILTPNPSHVDLIKKAARSKKILICEKPMAMTYKEALEGIKEVEKNNILHCIDFNYRKATPIALIKKIVDEGEIGEIYTWKIDFLINHYWEKDAPNSWRLKKKFSGGGASYDLNVHSINLAHFLVDEIADLVSLEKTFIPERDTDDYCACISNFKNGAVGIFDASRISAGDRIKNTLEIRGTKGAITWDYQAFNFIYLFSKKRNTGENGFKKINATEINHPYMNGYYGLAGYGDTYSSLIVHQIYDFLKAIEKNKMPSPNLYDGVKAQRVLEAMKISSEEKRWVKIDDVN